MDSAVRELLFQARRPRDLDTLVLAGVIGMSLKAGRKPLIRGLSESRFQKLLNEYFLGLALENGESGGPANADSRFAGLLELLLEQRTEPSEPAAWLAYAIASAACGENALWQDMGLPSRKHLTDALHLRFTPLAARNVRAIAWKTFFCRQLRERAGVSPGKSPYCADCPDHAASCGREDG